MITKNQVGSDGLLVAWSPPGQDEVDNHHHHQHHHEHHRQHHNQYLRINLLHHATPILVTFFMVSFIKIIVLDLDTESFIETSS